MGSQVGRLEGGSKYWMREKSRAEAGGNLLAGDLPPPTPHPPPPPSPPEIRCKVLMVVGAGQLLRDGAAGQDGGLVRPAAGNVALGVTPTCGKGGGGYGVTPACGAGMWQ